MGKVLQLKTAVVKSSVLKGSALHSSVRQRSHRVASTSLKSAPRVTAGVVSTKGNTLDDSLEADIRKLVKVERHNEARVMVFPGSSERDARYKQRAQILIYQAASLLAEVEGSEQRLAWLLEDCADLLVRDEQLGPVA
jgi:hypothetical protein